MPAGARPERQSKGGHDVMPAKAGIQNKAASELRACFI